MPQPEKLTPPRAEVSPIVMDAKGLPVLDTRAKRDFWLERAIRSGLAPKHITTVERANQVVDLISSMGLPFQAYWHLTYFANDKLGVMSDLILASCRASGQLEWLEVIHLDKENNRLTEENAANFEAYCCVVRAKRKGDEKIALARFTRKQAEDAGLFRNQVWKSYTEDMLMHKARTRALRNLFVDCCGGAPCREDMLGVDPMLDDDGVQIRTPEGVPIYQKRQQRARERLEALRQGD